MAARTGAEFLAGLKSPRAELSALFGGSRNSGIGREGGNWSFDFYCDVKNIAAAKGSFARRTL